MAKDKIPTSRVGRTARIGGLAAGQAIRQAGTRAANVTRTKEGREAALERRHIEAAEQIVAALGTMKGAAMKVGQVASFIDTGAFPPEFQERIQAKLAELDSNGRNLRVFETGDPAVLMVLEKTETERGEYGIERDEGLVADLKLFARASQLS